MPRSIVSFWFSVVLTFIAVPARSIDNHKDATEAYRQAFSNPANPSAFEAFRKKLPKAGAYYVVEGDLLLTENELHAYVDSKQPARALKDRAAELLVNTYGGDVDYYKDPASRVLTYSIQRSSFPTEQQYNETVANFAAAAKAWEDTCSACKIQFIYKPEFNDQALAEKTNFVVRYFDSGGQFIAASFFPHDAPVRRFVNVDPSYFSSPGFDTVGVFRHEIGHILGYRHEHIQGIVGCSLEDNQWVPLTAYDSHSVMHYFCGGGGSLQLQITPIDISGHQKLYANEEAALRNSESSAILFIRIEGGDVSAEAAHALMRLEDHDVLPKKQYALRSGESPWQAYLKVLGLPGAGPELFELIARLNPGLKSRHLRIGTSILVPNVIFATYSFSKQLDSRLDKDRQQIIAVSSRWNYLVKTPLTKTCPTDAGTHQECADSPQSKVVLTGYEARVEIPDAKLRTVVNSINRMKRANLLVVYRSSNTQKQPLFSAINPSDYLRRYRSAQYLPLNDEAHVAELIRLPEHQCANTSRGHPNLILVDEPVFRHPDLDGAVDIFDGQQIDSPVDLAKQRYATVGNSYVRDRDHGTHLAGLMVAKENGFGIVGVDPEGHVSPWNWSFLQQQVDTFIDKIGYASENIRFPIFVFASIWPRDQVRAITNRVTGTKRLWIVAAGQKDSGPGEDLSPNSDSPMNLGDANHILVVTACQDCYGPGARLLTGANFSTNHLVHVAAPGESIPSTISRGSYDSASGTSQATALVAGLASAMKACWPDFYDAERLKSRIQLTSLPSLLGDDFNRLLGGVVDGKAAILDPEANWIITTSSAGPNVLTDEYKKVEPQNWCINTLTLRNDDGNPTDTVDVRRIRRIVSVGGEWVVYYRPAPVGANQRLADIWKMGPGMPQEFDPNKPLLQTNGASPLTLAQIKDLILEGAVNYSSCVP